MNRSHRSLLLALALTGAASAFAATPGAASAPAGAMPHGAKQMHEAMRAGMQKMQAMQPSGDTDRDFAMMMRMHHQQAVDMAQVQLQHGKSDELKAMARKMIQDQQKEIAQLDQWLARRQ